MKLNIAVLGFGYWGPNLVRNFSVISDCLVSYIFDKDETKLKNAKKIYPDTKCTDNFKDILLDKNVDAVVIALPVCQHYKYAKLALEHNKHILVEKPCTDSEEKLKELVNLADTKKLVLMIDYTFLYTSAIRKIRELIDANVVGNILFFDAQRMNLGIFRNDVNVVWDLAVHDISIMQYILKDFPSSVIATGIAHTENDIEDIAYLSFKFKNRKIAHINCSWISPFKTKKIIIGGSNKTIVYDDIEPTEKIKVYDKGYDIFCICSDREKILTDYRMGDIFIPKLSHEEALFNMCKDFISSIINKTVPLANLRFALKVSSILSACSKSLLNNGQEINI